MGSTCTNPIHYFEWMLPFQMSGTMKIPALSYQRNKERQIGSPSAYNSKNMTEADEAWRTMLTGYGIISFPESYATEHNMIGTLRYSVESPEAGKSRVYLVEAYHAMHCLRMVRLHYRALETGTHWDWDIAHDYHCFDSLRQYIMCNPDYTLWYISGHRVNGYMQTKSCQDWDALRDWTEEHTSNYYDQYDMEPGTIGDNLWYNYHAGDGLPVGSL
ncbi:hypothetical protein BCON_0008g00990 [Botryotinia convoluta]|uniref:Uncharacterized protein n=1 Tax=Botryotinia convoluta TaxID=54673 RepID=A0A4Z1IRY2_9HELO|nr:hypothetical protein BCON_0008g00990 [Botryotinia convoluta]